MARYRKHQRNPHKRQYWRDSSEAPQPSRNRLYRDPERGKLAGVCAGLADYFGISPCAMRWIVVILALATSCGPVILIYIVLIFALEKKPRTLYTDDREEAFWRAMRVEPRGTARDIRQRFREIERRIRKMEAHVTSKRFSLNREINDL